MKLQILLLNYMNMNCRYKKYKQAEGAFNNYIEEAKTSLRRPLKNKNLNYLLVYCEGQGP